MRKICFMKSTMIMLASINDVKTFVNIVMNYDFEVDLVSGRHVIDAKSIMGIFSIDLSKPLQINVYGEDTEKFFNDIRPFIVD